MKKANACMNCGTNFKNVQALRCHQRFSKQCRQIDTPIGKQKEFNKPSNFVTKLCDFQTRLASLVEEREDLCYRLDAVERDLLDLIGDK